MAKPAVRRVSSDDCAVASNDEVCYPHEGEWIECIPGMEVRVLKVLQRFGALSGEYAALEGDADAAVKTLTITDAAINSAIPVLRDRITGWNWTDDRGRPLPLPDDDPEVFGRLRGEEIAYLISAVQGSTGAESKNAGSGTPTISSATALRATAGKTPTTARSRTKA